MKTIETITIINGSLFGKDSIAFNTQADYENHINAMIDYVESRKQDGFKSLITENCIAWKDAEVITICAIKQGRPQYWLINQNSRTVIKWI